MRGTIRAKPSDQISNARLRHDGAPSRWDFWAALDVEKNGAPSARNRTGCIMLDFDKPSVRGVIQPHALFFKPRWWVSRIDTNVPIVVWQ